jgi:predicted small lipoprotein YifL
MKSVMFVRGLLVIMLLLALAGCGENEQTQSKPA